MNLDRQLYRKALAVAIGVGVAMSTGDVDRGIAEAAARCEEDVEDLLFKINHERHVRRVLTKHGLE